LYQAGINVLRPTARGIMPLAAKTLAIDEDLRPIGVRRLLTLLRRIVLRDGLELIFEPNGEVLHRALQRRFEALMAELFARGAFAPARSADAFQVTVDPTGAEKGQLAIELRIAPSRPLAFLVVRLLRSGDRLTLEES
jgi:phage tail sheath protein FI